MELLYVWIEEYNNIHHQGFNFSPKHHFHFEPNEKEGPVTGGTLTHNEINTSYPDNFFGKSISNITAIVGKNGSGKSSLVKRLAEGVARSNAVFVYKQEQTYHCDSNIEKIEKPVHILKGISGVIHNRVIYYSPFINSNTNYIEGFNWGDISSIFQISKALQATIKDQEISKTSIERLCMPLMASYHTQEMELQIRFVSNASNLKIIPFRLPSEIHLTIPIYSEIDKSKESLEIEGLIAKAIHHNLKARYDKDQSKEEFAKELFNKNRFEALEYLKGRVYPNSFIEEIKKLSKNLRKKKGYRSSNVYKVIIPLQDFFSLGLFPEKKKFNSKVFYNEKRWVIDAGIKLVWRDMSDGEISLLTLMSRLWDNLEQLESKPSIIILDEFELGLHPQWQKESIIKLISFFSLLSKKGYHIIITTHSPILLSDLPRENVIFLNTEKDEKGKPWCKVYEPENIDRTFGANIHSLYRSSFFMNGVMGEFAKEKIDGVIKDLRGNGEIKEERKKEIHYIIDMIGEPIIRNQLRKMYNEKFHKYDSLDERIAKLENELAELKNMKK